MSTVLSSIIHSDTEESIGNPSEFFYESDEAPSSLSVKIKKIEEWLSNLKLKSKSMTKSQLEQQKAVVDKIKETIDAQETS